MQIDFAELFAVPGHRLLGRVSVCSRRHPYEVIVPVVDPWTAQLVGSGKVMW
jgi:hypothetical protein